jgi:hypothetical protein
MDQKLNCCSEVAKKSSNSLAGIPACDAYTINGSILQIQNTARYCTPMTSKRFV